MFLSFWEISHCIDSFPVIILWASIKSPLLLLFPVLLAHTLSTFPRNLNTCSPESFVWLFFALSPSANLDILNIDPIVYVIDEKYDPSTDPCGAPFSTVLQLECLSPMPFNTLLFIHFEYFYSASSSPQLLRGAPDSARIPCRSFTPKRHRQLQLK